MEKERFKQVLTNNLILFFVVIVFFVFPKKIFLLLKSKKAFCKLLKSKNRYELYIMHTSGGGTETYLKNILRDKKHYIILRNYKIFDAQEIYKLEIAGLNSVVFISKSDIQKLNCIISLLSVENLCGYKNLPFLLNTFKRFTAKTVFKIHDYFSICPSVTLTKGSHYCGASCSGACDFVVTGKKYTVKKWRELWESFFENVDEFLFFSESSVKIFTSVYPVDSEKIIVKPHDMSYFAAKTITSMPEKMNIGVFGSVITEVKGHSVLKDFVEFVKDKDCKICINGNANTADYSDNKNCICYGSYKSNEIYERIISQQIGVVFFPSICPETFSYVVSEVIMTGIPIVCFDVGAQAEKVRNYKLGRIIPDMSNESVLNTLIAAYEEGKKFYKKVYKCE